MVGAALSRLCPPCRFHAQALICPASQAKSVHGRHAQIARRANLSQARDVADFSKSEA
jgi:hypothetical protein